MPACRRQTGARFLTNLGDQGTTQGFVIIPCRLRLRPWCRSCRGSGPVPDSRCECRMHERRSCRAGIEQQISVTSPIRSVTMDETRRAGARTAAGPGR